MLENLQEAYTSYQQALYHLRDPKVGFCLQSLSLSDHPGTPTLVRNRHPV